MEQKMIRLFDEIYYRDLHLIRVVDDDAPQALLQVMRRVVYENGLDGWEHVSTHTSDLKTDLNRIKKPFWDLYGKSK